jgi:hypothetical protein
MRLILVESAVINLIGLIRPGFAEENPRSEPGFAGERRGIFN